MSVEVRTVSSTGGEKGVKMARFDLLPTGPLWEVAELYGEGASKYADHNWRNGYEYSKSFAALMRHAWSWWNGEEIDPEMGKSHMAAVVFHAFALMEFHENFPEFDDRFKRASGADLQDVDVDEWERQAFGLDEDAPKFKVGDRVLITGDEGNYTHGGTGEYATITGPTTFDYDTGLPGWSVTVIEDSEWPYQWEVAEIDLKPAPVVFEVGAKVRHRDLGYVGHIIEAGEASFASGPRWLVDWDVTPPDWRSGTTTATDPEHALELVVE